MLLEKVALIERSSSWRQVDLSMELSPRKSPMDRVPDIENPMDRVSDIENPMYTSEEFPTLEGYEDEEDLDMIGRNSLADMTDTIQHRRKLKEQVPETMLDKFIMKRKKIVQALEYRDLNKFTQFLLILLILPISVFCLLKQFRIFVILGVFNYTGFNLRPYLLVDIDTERDVMRMEEKYRGGPMTLSKVFYIAHRYMTYWIVLVLLTIALPFINDITLLDILNKYDFYKDNPTINYVLQVALSLIIGFANIIPSRAVRPEISTFISTFTEEDYTIRDSPHTRLKEIAEVLNDIKIYGFVLLHTELGNPIIVSIKAPEELRLLDGFKALLSIDTFDNNKIVRFIQIEQDVDSFFVLRNDVGMCHRIEFDPYQWTNVLDDLKDFKLRVEITELELNIYGGASFVLLVGLFSAFAHLPTTVILLAWAIWPVVYALMYRKRKSKLASINLFTLDGKDRKYQPFNNICVSSDDVIMARIHEFKFFKALFKFTLQGKFLVHTLLKVTENVNYDWLDEGLKMKDFKRFAASAAVTYERDVGVISPNARCYYSAPRKSNEMCVVCMISHAGEITSQQMTRVQFEKASAKLPNGDDISSLENMYFK